MYDEIKCSCTLETPLPMWYESESGPLWEQGNSTMPRSKVSQESEGDLYLHILQVISFKNRMPSLFFACSYSYNSNYNIKAIGSYNMAVPVSGSHCTAQSCAQKHQLHFWDWTELTCSPLNQKLLRANMIIKIIPITTLTPKLFHIKDNFHEVLQLLKTFITFKARTTKKNVWFSLPWLIYLINLVLSALTPAWSNTDYFSLKSSI